LRTPIYICGPTASGKSALAIELAKKHDGEIINADAYQVYRGLEILSACPDARERAEIDHHLFSIVDVSEEMNAQIHRERVLNTITDLQSRDKLPIIVGGSGMYLKFITHGPSPIPAGDDLLREKLESRSTESLVSEFSSLDPHGAAITNLKNRRYVIRALEICLMSGKPMSEVKNHWAKQSEALEATLKGIVFNWEREPLRQRIAKRTKIMIETGAIDEVKALQDPSHPETNTCIKAIGYKEISAYLNGETTREKCEELIFFATCQYAKRQRPWFKKENWLSPIDIDEESQLDEIIRISETALAL